MRILIDFKILDFFYFGISTLFLTMLFSSTVTFAQNKKPQANFKDPEKLVRHLYEQVTFPPGKTPDWKYIRTLFIKESIVVMRVGRNETATLSLDGWVLDFVNFINNSEVKKTGFQEKVIKTNTTVFGDIAHIMVLYTSHIPGKGRAPREGVDSFHLIRKNGRWQIVSILNEIPNKNRPKPDVLK